MERSIIIAGFGGQGVLLIGKIIANIFMKNNKKVTWYPCYGSEMRGGAVNCEIVVSDDEVTSVHKKKTDILVCLNDISFKKFISHVNQGGTVIANTSLIKNINIADNIKVIKAAISDMAIKLGNVKVSNMVALGILSTLFENINFSEIPNNIKNLFPNKPELVNLNIKAFMEGKQLGMESV